MKSINKDMQDYFIKIAPDFSVLDMIEKYFYDNDEAEGIFKDVCYYKSNILANVDVDVPIYRGMFIIHSTGDITVNMEDDEFTVFPYCPDTQILIALNDSNIVISSDAVIDLIVGVAF